MTTPGKGRIFISYRRADSAGYAGRIYDRLTAHFGKDAVFMDVDTIEAGLDFVEVLQNAVQCCDVLVALIGRSWLNIKDEAGKRRLDNPEDFVRIEVAAALDREIRVIPVLVDGAPMPHSTELPDNLKLLARRNALQVNHHSFNADANHLISQLELALKARERTETEKIHQGKAKIEPLPAIKRKVTKPTKLRKSLFIIFSIIGLGILLFLGFIFAVNPFNQQSLALTASSLPSLDVGSTMISEKDNMVIVYVPAGEFKMGGDADDALAVCQKFSTTCQRDWFTAEEPIHTVDLNAFWIDQTEITNAMYARCVDAGVCEPPSDNSSYTRDSYYGNSEYNDYPVIYVSWDQAKTYCEWAGRRLPTEAEWEKAAGWDEDGQVQRMYPWGDAFNGNVVNFCDVNCNIRKNADYDDGFEDTSPVGRYPSGESYYGAHDMAGNVWEWVLDWYDVYPGGDKNVSEYFGQTYHLLRGGGWTSSASFVRSARRSRSDPTNSDPASDLGFRCARDANP